MCGIAGIVLPPNQQAVALGERVERMCRSMAHRGPDDSGVTLSAGGRIALGNRRLAVRDVSPAGHMPMCDESGQLSITYNGEIYNAAELRLQLESAGVHFLSSSDTEVILRGYERWGVGVVSRLRGMFAFALLDSRPNGGSRPGPTLLLARDPLGIKPLYYAHDSRGLVFASECRGLLASGLVSREISAEGLVSYLRLGSVPAPITIYRDIVALMPGSLLVVDTENPGAGAALEQYWQLPPVQEGVAEATRIESLRRTVEDSVRQHLVSDVPLGAFLSGGLDSSAVVAMMRIVDPGRRIRTCTLAFEGDDSEDPRYARTVAQAYATEHVELLLTADDVGRQLDAMIAALDQPSIDGLNTYLVCKLARQCGLTVALSGIGGDELFGGYRTFHRLQTSKRLAAMLSAIPAAAALARAGLNAVVPYHPAARVADWTHVGGQDSAAQYLALRGLFASGSLSRLLRPDVLAQADVERGLLNQVREAANATDGPWDAASRLELTCYMRNQLLRDGDAMSMAHSLEVRVPFVDQVVVEAVLRTPLDERRGEPAKRLLRAIVPSLPAAVRERRTKRWFSLPLDRWMAGPLRAQVGGLIEQVETSLDGLIVRGAARRLLADFEAGRTTWSRVWSVAALAAVGGSK